MRLIVIDKENGGKADALNAGINASTAPYFVSLDADSILDQRALKELMRVIQEDPAGGGGRRTGRHRQRLHRPQQPGRERRPARPIACRGSRWWSTFARSPPAGPGSTGCGSILILSGVFAVFEKETVIRAGGYLTPFLRHRITEEYVGERVGTVCEDMEIIVRLHRFVLRQAARTGGSCSCPTRWPGPRCPRRSSRFGKQRGRWYRGLRESLRYHRAMLWRTQVRPDRLVCPAGLLAVRVLRAAGGDRRLRSASCSS